MSVDFNESISELLSESLDNSDVYGSEKYSEISNRMAEYALIISGNISDNLFSSYREAQIDMEALFYKYGFLEGVKYAQTLASVSPEEIL